MILYFLRHGETIFNINHICQGQSDSPLTDNGKKQVYAAGKALKSIDFSHAYVSDLGRTGETYDYFIKAYQKEIPVSYHQELREMAFGSMENKSFSKMPEDLNFFTGFKKIGGEDRYEVAKRIYCFISSLELNKTENVLFISHGWAIRSLFDFLFFIETENKLAKQNHKTLNASLSILNYSDFRWKADKIFDIEYRLKGDDNGK